MHIVAVTDRLAPEKRRPELDRPLNEFICGLTSDASTMTILGHGLAVILTTMVQSIVIGNLLFWAIRNPYARFMPS